MKTLDKCGLVLAATTFFVSLDIIEKVGKMREVSAESIRAIENGEVALTGIGVKCHTKFDSFNGHKIIVDEVVQNSPAERAELQSGDVITKINGTRVDEATKLQEITHSNANMNCSVTVQRGSETLVLNVMPQEDMIITKTPDGGTRVRETE